MKLLNVEIGLVCVMLIIFKEPQFYPKVSSLCLWRIKYSGKKSSSNNKKTAAAAAAAVEKQQQQKAIKDILNNPLQVKKIKESKDMKEKLKKIKKEKKSKKSGKENS
jgi:hypothetical protein